MPKAKTRNFDGFGVVTHQGHFLWQYSRPDEQQARDAYEAHNPQIEGHEDGYSIKKLRGEIWKAKEWQNNNIMI